MWHVESYFPYQGSNPCLLQWKHRVLTTGPPGNSLIHCECAKSLQPCLFAMPWTVAHQAPPSMGFSIQEYWNALPCPLPGDLPDPGIELHLLPLLHWRVGSLSLMPSGKPSLIHYSLQNVRLSSDFPTFPFGALFSCPGFHINRSSCFLPLNLTVSGSFIFFHDADTWE